MAAPPKPHHHRPEPRSASQPLIDKHLILMDFEAMDSETVLRALCTRLTQAECVDDDFCEAVVQREREFPTGLAAELPVALPHTVPEHCRRTALAVAILSHEVTFLSMEDRESEVRVRLVFLPTVTRLATDHMWISRLAELIRTPVTLGTILQASSAEAVAKILARHLLDSERKGSGDVNT